MTPSDDPIKHVILVMLENGSCDRYLGCLTESILPDFDGVKTSSRGFNKDSFGTVFEQSPTEEKQVHWDPFHEQEKFSDDQLA